MVSILGYEEMLYGISTSDSDEYCKKIQILLQKKGGNRAVAEACKHVAYKFLKNNNLI